MPLPVPDVLQPGSSSSLRSMFRTGSASTAGGTARPRSASPAPDLFHPGPTTPARLLAHAGPMPSVSRVTRCGSPAPAPNPFHLGSLPFSQRSSHSGPMLALSGIAHLASTMSLSGFVDINSILTSHRLAQFDFTLFASDLVRAEVPTALHSCPRLNFLLVLSRVT